jgi:hypothetical protein
LVIDNDAVVATKLRDLIRLPDIAVTGGLADKEKRGAFPEYLVIEP